MQLWKERTVIELEFYWSGGRCNGVKPQWIYYTKAIDNGSAYCFSARQVLGDLATVIETKENAV